MRIIAQEYKNGSSHAKRIEREVIINEILLFALSPHLLSNVVIVNRDELAIYIS